MSLLLSTKVILPHWAWKDRTTKIPGSPLEDIQPITICQHSVPTWSERKKKCYKDSFPFGVFVCMHIRVCTGMCTHTHGSQAQVSVLKAMATFVLGTGSLTGSESHQISSADRTRSPWNLSTSTSPVLELPAQDQPPYLSLHKCVSWDQTQVFHGKHFTDGAIFPTWKTLKILTTVGINTFPLGLLQN